MTVTEYIGRLDSKQAAICRSLRKEISAVLPKAEARLYHGSPAWFIGENAVVGFSARPNGVVTLLFWNGKALGEPALDPVGKFQAAQARYAAVSDIAVGDLRRWLRKASKDIWDFAGIRKGVAKRPIRSRG
ncbi:MAG: DUF1801 domain-containing protein [Polyangia bacterium]